MKEFQKDKLLQMCYCNLIMNQNSKQDISKCVVL